MSHHSPDKGLTDMSAVDSVLEKKLQQLSDPAVVAKQAQLSETLGPTGDFPAGKLVPHDEGGLMFGVTVFGGRVVFDFGKPIHSIGFTRNEALELAELIKRNAERCPPIIGKPDPSAA